MWIVRRNRRPSRQKFSGPALRLCCNGGEELSGTGYAKFQIFAAIRRRIQTDTAIARRAAISLRIRPKPARGGHHSDIQAGTIGRRAGTTSAQHKRRGFASRHLWQWLPGEEENAAPDSYGRIEAMIDFGWCVGVGGDECVRSGSRLARPKLARIKLARE
jgi:hypothetical protein